MSQFENEQTESCARESPEHPITGKFDLMRLKAIHAHIFQDVYDWAGKSLTLEINKGGAFFVRTPYIEGEVKRLSASLANERYLRGLDKPRFFERPAHYYAEWNAPHPFREGNGCGTRKFIGQLAHEAGYAFDQTRNDNNKNQWSNTAKRSFNGDLEPLKQIFNEAIQPVRERRTEREAGLDSKVI